ncbi:DUF6119 family protein [Streptomyces filamentosus]|uniref:DUF6119 family protein n=1 Tax=Streptomyces filamentosus TaxID=67294 RepID=UPI001677FDAA|nr:DUF6119 family protein [Streptomyces filamentosus]
MIVAERNPTLRFNCFLLREGLKDCEKALRVQYRPGSKSEMRKLANSDNAPDGCVAYLRDRTENVPAWARLLAPAFSELEGVLNFSNRLVIFLPVKNRTFAICFGYGSSTLEWSWVEANFGLRFAARRFDSKAMTGVGSRRIDSSARSQWVQIPTNSSISDFEVELDGEFTRKLIGNLSEGVEFPELGAVVATDSVAFKLETDLNRVRDVLGVMLETAETGDVTKDLAFIDSLEPLRAKSEVVKTLERLLTMEFFGDRVRNTQGPAAEGLDVHLLAFAPPDDLSVENIHNFVIYKGEDSQEFEEMSLQSLRAAILSFPGKFGVTSLASMKVQARDSNGAAASIARPLKHWLIFEAGNQDRRYLLTLGKWYALAESYSKKLDEDLAQIEDVTDVLNLRTWDDWGPKKNWEKHFNERAAEGRNDLICLDRHPIYSEGDQIEACDLLHADGYLVHVKKYTGSQTLSHLFSQGFVSAQTLISDAAYRSDFLEAVNSINPALVGVAGSMPPKFVTYAIAFDDQQWLPQDLPTFSKVNLRSFSKRIKLLGSTATLARVQMTFKSKDT